MHYNAQQQNKHRFQFMFLVGFVNLQVQCFCYDTSVWSFSCFPFLPLSPPFPSLNLLKIDGPLSYHTDWTSQTFESQFMELTFSLTDNSLQFVCVPAAKLHVRQPCCCHSASVNVLKRVKLAEHIL